MKYLLFPGNIGKPNRDRGFYGGGEQGGPPHPLAPHRHPSRAAEIAKLGKLTHSCQKILTLIDTAGKINTLF